MVNPEKCDSFRNDEVQSVHWVCNAAGSRTATLTTVAKMLVLVTTPCDSDTNNTVTTLDTISRA